MLLYGKKATVLLFVTPDCPIVNGYGPEIARLAGEFSAGGIAFHAVYVDPATALSAARSHARAFGPGFDALCDPRHELVRRFRASVTPEAVVFGPDRRLCYRGRIDDRYPRLGVRRPTIARRDLRDALLAVLARKPIAVPETVAVGCLIPDLRR